MLINNNVNEKENKSLLIFTDTYPFGTRETFLQTELIYLSQSFQNITILPLEKGNTNIKRKLPANIKLIEPPFNSTKNKLELIRKGFLNSSGIGCHLIEFFKSRVFLSPVKFRNWFTHLLLIRAELAYLNTITFNSEYDLNYFYWGLRWSQVVPFVNFEKSKAIVRFHGSDLYDERNHNYIPFRKEQLKKIELAVFVSEMGKNYLKERYSELLQTTFVSRLGTEDFGIGPYTGGRNMHIVSCSSIIALKQIDLLAQALKFIKYEVQWTHIGDGPLKNKIINIVSELGKNVKVNLKGQVDREVLMQFYQQIQVDIFVNTSLSEGVPVSVMEALSFGIPVIATDVGGTREIVDEEVGFLISPGISPEELAKTIELLFNSNSYLQLRKNSRLRWEERCQAKLLFSEFANMLKYF